MGPLGNAMLGVVFLGAACAGVLTMLWLRGGRGGDGGDGGKAKKRANGGDTAGVAPPFSTGEAGEPSAARADRSRAEANAKPHMAGRRPAVVRLKPGKHAWCSCGLSQNQPFCDGAHRGGPFRPLVFTVEEERTAALCLCKRTNKPPYCDGSHARLAEAGEPAAPPGLQPDRTERPAPRNTAEEPTLEWVHALAREGLEGLGRHGPLGAMGPPRHQLPQWSDLLVLTAQLATRPLPEEAEVACELVVGPRAKRPLRAATPILIADMSYGSLSPEAKLALARGAEAAGAGVCTGEGGVSPEELEANSRLLFELGTAGFGYREELLPRIAAFHFKAGQAAKTGIGGHLPGEKVVGRIARVRGLPEGRAAFSPPAFPGLASPQDFARFADAVREQSGGVPVGFKMSAQHLEADLAFALEAGADYVILDGRGGGTGAAPLIFRDNISLPTIPALARARRFLDRRGADHVTLIATGGLRTPADFVKAFCLGADGVAIGNAALQAIGCVAARICHTNHCPSGVATQDERLRARLDPDEAAARLHRFLTGCLELMKTLARACGHRSLKDFSPKDLAACRRDVAELAGVAFAGEPEA